MMKTFLTLALTLALTAPAGAVSSQAGTSGAQFLKLGSGARAGGMADAFSAIADDATAVYYNPAGLNQLKGAQLAGAHTAYFQGINYESLNFAVPFDKRDQFSRHVLGFGIYQLSVSNIERRVNDTTDPIGTFGSSDGAYSVSYAFAMDRRFSVGATGKYIVENIDSYKASAYALDAGLLYRMNPDAARPVQLSAVFKNLGSRTGYVSGQSDPLPFSTGFGASTYVVPKTLRMNVEIVKFRDESGYGAFGGEWLHTFNDAMSGAVRFGYSSQRSSTPGLIGMTAGGGVTFRKASFDFAWVPFGVLGDTFRYSLIIKF